MNVRPGAAAALIARCWSRLYTLGMPHTARRRRLAEIDSWMWEQRAEASHNRRAGWRTELLIARSTLRGALDDLAWRREQSSHRNRNAAHAPHHYSQGSFMDKLIQDVLLAVRTVVRNPGFALTAIVTLSLGIGANVAIFALTNTMLFKSLPYPNGEDLVLLWEAQPERDFNQISLSAPNYVDFRAQQTVFTDIAALEEASFTLLSGGDPERIEGARAAAALFDVLQVGAAHGRVFGEAEDRPGAARVALISDGLWRGRFGGDPAVVGSSINIDGQSHTVLGIMPRDFNFPRDEHIWVPLAIDLTQEHRASHGLDAIARLREGVDLEGAYAEMAGIAGRLAEAYPETNGGSSVYLASLREEEIGEEKILVYVLSGVVGFVLLIACANVANLTLARSATRRQELAVRAALGAGRGRLVRQLLTESLVLSLAGGAIGLLLGAAGKNMIVASYPPGVPTWLNWNFDGTVYAFLVAVTLLTGLLFGFVPALQASRGGLGGALQATGRVAGRRSWLRGGLVVAEVALAMILLIGAGLMVRAYFNVTAVNPGFDPSDLLIARVSLPEAEYAEGDARVRFFEELLERVGALPAIESATATSLLPVGSYQGTYFAVEGSETDPGRLPVVTFARVTPGYFETLGIPLLEGRTLRAGDGAPGTPEVLLITRTAAERFFPEDSPLGKRVKFGPLDNPESEFKTIVGVVDDVMQTGIGDDYYPGVYVPLAQSPVNSMALVARTSGDADAVVGAVREELWQIDDDLPMYQVTTMAERIAQDDWEQKLFTRIFASFAAIALVLASVGLYGLVSYSVAQRSREIGVRMALGADRRKVVRMVVRQGMMLTAIGLLLGLLGSLAITQAIESLLFGVSPTDPATFGGIFAVLAAVAFAASWLPARRATRVDPVSALREQ